MTLQVSKVWLEKLINYQDEKQLKLAPKLTSGHVKPSQFQKMSVQFAAQVNYFSL